MIEQNKPWLNEKGELHSWLTVTADGAVVRLKKAVKVLGDANGEGATSVDRLTLRSPTIRDQRGAAKQAPGDLEEQELILFASLAGIATKELEGLQAVDYNRVTAAYFRLVYDDGI